MPIHQINLFVCDQCGKKDTFCEEVILYDDPVVSLDRWGYYSGTDPDKTDKLLCPACILLFCPAKSHAD